MSKWSASLSTLQSGVPGLNSLLTSCWLCFSVVPGCPNSLDILVRTSSQMGCLSPSLFFIFFVVAGVSRGGGGGCVTMFNV